MNPVEWLLYAAACQLWAAHPVDSWYKAVCYVCDYGDSVAWS